MYTMRLPTTLPRKGQICVPRVPLCGAPYPRLTTVVLERCGNNSARRANVGFAIARKSGALPPYRILAVPLDSFREMESGDSGHEGRLAEIFREPYSSRVVNGVAS